MSSENSSTQTAAAVADAPVSGRDGQRLVPHAQTPGTPVYLVMFGSRHHVPDETTYFNLWASWDGIIIDPELGSIPESTPLPSGAYLAQAPDTAPIYLVINRVKLWITSQAVMARFAFDNSKVREVSASVLDGIPNGPNIN